MNFIQRYQRLSAVNSNACKFTPFGGKLTIKTRLIIPALPSRMDNTNSEVLSEKCIDVEGDVQRPLSTGYLSQHDKQQDKPSSSLEWIAVRIEVTDTGYGIKPQDMAQSKLFCKSLAFLPLEEPGIDLAYHSCVQPDRARKATRLVKLSCFTITL